LALGEAQSVPEEPCALDLVGQKIDFFLIIGVMDAVEQEIGPVGAW
jgi:hypothetical protein